MATTPAEIPAEAATAQRTHYDPAFPIDLIREHPKNIRHNATADAELIESVRVQGLLQPLVAFSDPIVEGVDLIAGHRRLDALRKAGYTHAPVVIRYDLADEADQVAAMLVENGRRADLTPIEEAEGFDLLAELGWDAEKIAQASGRSKTLVKERRRLTVLPEKAKAAVDVGQVTIEDALRIAKLPVAEQTRLEKYLNNADFHYEVRRTEERLKAAAAATALAKELTAVGAKEIPAPKLLTNEYYLNHAEHGMVRLAVTGKPDADQHDGCLAFMRGGTKQYPAIWVGCTDPGKHEADLSAEQRQRQQERAEADAAEAAEREARSQAHREELEAERVARQLRADTMLAGLKLTSTKLDPNLQKLITLALPDLLWRLDGGLGDIFQDLAGVPEAERWGGWLALDEPDEPGAQWARNLVDQQGAAPLKVLAALLITTIEDRLSQLSAHDDLDQKIAPAYFAALAAVGHEKNTADKQLLAKLAPADGEA